MTKVNAATLKPGDSVLFKRGGAWREALVVPASGTAPITFATYGTGAKPRFIGSDVVASAAFRDAGDGIYTADVTTPVNAVLRGTTFLFDPQGKPLDDVAESYT